MNAAALEQDYEILSELDFIFAKANLAKSYNGVAPEFNTDGHINIRKGRHPLWMLKGGPYRCTARRGL